MVAPKWYRDRWLVGILVLAAILGLIYNGVIMVGYGVDETRHMNYVKLLFEERTFPHLVAGGVVDAMGHEPEYKGAHTYHPPLYYLALVPFYALFHNLPGDAVWHLLRGISLLMCLAALPFAYQIALRATRGSLPASRLCVAQIALVPMWGMTAATVINDALVFLMATVFLWLLVVVYPHERSLKSAGVIGLVFGLCIVSKANALPANAVALAIYLIAQYGKNVWRSGEAWKRLAIVVGVSILIAGPWHLYNLAQYGSLMHSPPPMPSPALPAPSSGILVMMLHDNFPQHVVLVFQGLFNTMWAQKDWIPEGMRDGIYWAFFLYCLIALVGLVAKRSRTNDEAVTPEQSLSQRLALLTSGGAFLVSALIVIVIALFVHWGWADGGRYLFPALIGISVLIASGWQQLAGRKGASAVLGLWIAAMLLLNGTCIYWLVIYLNPKVG